MFETVATVKKIRWEWYIKPWHCKKKLKSGQVKTLIITQKITKGASSFTVKREQIEALLLK